MPCVCVHVNIFILAPSAPTVRNLSLRLLTSCHSQFWRVLFPEEEHMVLMNWRCLSSELLCPVVTTEQHRVSESFGYSLLFLLVHTGHQLSLFTKIQNAMTISLVCQMIRKSSLFMGFFSLTPPKDPQAYWQWFESHPSPCSVSCHLPGKWGLTLKVDFLTSVKLCLHHQSRSPLSLWCLLLLASVVLPWHPAPVTTVSQTGSNNVDPQKEGVRCFMSLSPEIFSSYLWVCGDNYIHTVPRTKSVTCFIYA